MAGRSRASCIRAVLFDCPHCAHHFGGRALRFRVRYLTFPSRFGSAVHQRRQRRRGRGFAGIVRAHHPLAQWLYAGLFVGGACSTRLLFGLDAFAYRFLYLRASLGQVIHFDEFIPFFRILSSEALALTCTSDGVGAHAARTPKPPRRRRALRRRPQRRRRRHPAASAAG